MEHLQLFLVLNAIDTVMNKTDMFLALDQETIYIYSCQCGGKYCIRCCDGEEWSGRASLRKQGPGGWERAIRPCSEGERASLAERSNEQDPKGANEYGVSEDLKDGEVTVCSKTRE